MRGEGEGCVPTFTVVNVDLLSGADTYILITINSHFTHKQKLVNNVVLSEASEAIVIKSYCCGSTHLRCKFLDSLRELVVAAVIK